MYDQSLAYAILEQIDRAVQTIQRRFAPIQSPDDFFVSDYTREKLDALCMQLIALGESVKNLDKVTEGTLLSRYPQVEWKRVMGMRDVISHHYFDMNAEIVFIVCQERIPELSEVVRQMLADLSSPGAGTPAPKP